MMNGKKRLGKFSLCIGFSADGTHPMKNPRSELRGFFTYVEDLPRANERNGDAMIEGLDSAIIYVADLPRAVEWYQTVLELPEPAQFGDFVVFNLDNVRLALHRADLEPAKRNNQGAMPVFSVASYDETKTALEAHDCKFFYENRLAHANFGSFHDLEGNPIQIIERL